MTTILRSMLNVGTSKVASATTYKGRDRVKPTSFSYCIVRKCTDTRTRTAPHVQTHTHTHTHTHTRTSVPTCITVVVIWKHSCMPLFKNALGVSFSMTGTNKSRQLWLCTLHFCTVRDSRRRLFGQRLTGRHLPTTYVQAQARRQTSGSHDS